MRNSPTEKPFYEHFCINEKHPYEQCLISLCARCSRDVEKGRLKRHPSAKHLVIRGCFKRQHSYDCERCGSTKADNSRVK